MGYIQNFEEQTTPQGAHTFFFPILFSNVLVLSVQFLLNLSSFFWMAIGLDKSKGVWSIYSQCLETWDNWVTSFVPPKMYYLVLITCSPYSLGLKGFSNMTQLNLKSTKRSLTAVCSHGNRPLAVAEPAETKRPKSQSPCCKCQTSAVLMNQ